MSHSPKEIHAMMPINAIARTSELGGSSPVTSDTVQASGDFSHVLQNEQLLPSSQPARAQAILNFYDIHQRSQITGVPIAEYNAAVAALGLDAEKDPFAAIQVLQEAGFETGAPSLGAILKYGATPQISGNQSYLAQGKAPVLAEVAQRAAAEPAVQKAPDREAVRQEVQALNTEFGHLLGDASSYFEAATQLAKQLPLEPYLQFTLNQALPMIQDALQLNQTAMTTDRWLQNKA